MIQCEVQRQSATKAVILHGLWFGHKWSNKLFMWPFAVPPDAAVTKITAQQ